MVRIFCFLTIGVLGCNLFAGDASDKPAGKSRELHAVVSTSKGDFRLQLYPEDAPLTTANFVNLAQRGFYKGLKFHRVVHDYVRGGDPAGNGRGGPGYEFKETKTSQHLHDAAGVLSMVRNGPRIGGSIFMITRKPALRLDGWHTIFGRVSSGMEVVQTLAVGDIIKSISIEGDASSLLETHQEQLAVWNGIIDRGGRITEPQRLERRHQAMRLVLEQGIDVTKGKSTDSGLWYVDLEQGSGDSPTAESSVTIHANGWLSDGTQFWSTRSSGKPVTDHPIAKFLPGIREGLLGMKVGGKRILIVPDHLGYGIKGNQSVGIPPNATLVYELELLGTK